MHTQCKVISENILSLSHTRLLPRDCWNQSRPYHITIYLLISEWMIFLSKKNDRSFSYSVIFPFLFNLSWCDNGRCA